MAQALRPGLEESSAYTPPHAELYRWNIYGWQQITVESGRTALV
jgi:hypothetical protein